MKIVSFYWLKLPFCSIFGFHCLCFPMKLYCLLILSFFAFSVAWGQTDSARLDAKSQHEKLWKESRKTRSEFLADYGKDDTTRALIYLFFRKKNSGIMEVSFAPLIAFSGVISEYIGSQTSQKAYSYVAYGLVGGYFVVMINSIIKMGRYTRFALLKLIKQHESGHPYPQKFLKRIVENDLQR